MKKIILFSSFIVFTLKLFAQDSTYNRRDVMIPMRDGVKLFTVILEPRNATASLPILIQRTPYGADLPENFNVLENSYLGNMAKEGYVFVWQDIRGKYKSEGTMQIHQPITHLKQKGTIDESTDTYDAIDWLVKNVKNNNG